MENYTNEKKAIHSPYLMLHSARQRKKREIVQNKNSLAVLRNGLTDLRKRSDYLSKWLDCFCYCLVLEKKNLFLVFFGSFEFVKGDGNCLIEFSIKYMFNYDG
jgi:hypothetical protein